MNSSRYALLAIALLAGGHADAATLRPAGLDRHSAFQPVQFCGIDVPCRPGDIMLPPGVSSDTLAIMNGLQNTMRGVNNQMNAAREMVRIQSEQRA